MTNCGTTANENCCTSLPVTGGTFYRVYTNSGTGPTGEASPATLTGLSIDKYLVTVGRFRQFVSAWNGGWRPTAGSGKHVHLNGGQGLANSGSAGTYETGWQSSDDSNVAPTDTNLACFGGMGTWTPNGSGNENVPINCVNWYEAYAFCIWDGGFLPSSAESEYVAAGGSQQREYPWGSTDPGTSTEYAIYNCVYPNGSGTCNGLTNLAPVGTPTLGAGVWGQLDLAGEVMEWNLDWSAPPVDPCTDCAYLTMPSPAYRIVRGGYFYDDNTLLWPYNPLASTPTARQYGFGLRCARVP